MLVGDLLGAIDDHEIEPLMHYAVGQGVAYLNEVKPVAAIVEELVAQARDALAALASVGKPAAAPGPDRR
jgi:hypothetical protein